MKFTCTLLLFIISISIGSSKHILSSEMTYECLSEGEYKINLTVYRDCLGGGADFDQTINVSIYEDETLYFTAQSSILNTTTILYNPYEDCDPNANDICVEKGFYTFNINLPVSEFPYTLAYQRCCWADNILNIVDPANTGITASTTISPIAQTLCNTQNSLDFPLAFTSCPNVPISIQLPTEDQEGDVLEYQLCLPYQGGGILGSGSEPGDPTSCEGLTPNPACPPPYLDVELTPGFDIDNPFPTVDGITLDNEIGEFSFTPSEQGRYIYSICYSEIRNGEVIGLGQTILQLANVVQDINPISDELLKLWKAYYVENSASIIITSDLNAKQNISIFNGNGALIHSENSTKNHIEIATTNWTKGIYFIQLKLDSKISTKKVIVY